MPRCKEVSERASALIYGGPVIFDPFQMHLHLAICKGRGAFIGQMHTTRDLTQMEPVADDVNVGHSFRALHLEASWHPTP